MKTPHEHCINGETDVCDQNEDKTSLLMEETRSKILGNNEKTLSGLEPDKKSSITVRMVARINFGGVFTDIPPYCIDMGGAVLNFPVKTRKGYPIEATASYKEGEMMFESMDGRETDPGYHVEGKIPGRCTFPLHEAVCKVAGVDKNIRLTTRSLLPRGSGLGTSSILAASMLMALYKLHRKPIDKNDIVNKVIAVEQLLGTCGGWQDPCGGIYPGFKICESKPGFPQLVKVKEIVVPKDFKGELERKLVVMYSGISRGAGDILRDMTIRYLNGEPKTLKAFEESREIAYRMKNCAKAGDMSGFALLMNRQTDVNMRLSPMHTGLAMREFIHEFATYADGVLITGAGGGGYVVGLLKNEYEKRDIAKIFRTTGLNYPEIESGLDLEPYEIEAAGRTE